MSEIREALNAAFEETAPVDAPAAGDVSAEVEPTPGIEPVKAEEAAPAPETAGPGRDEKGRFTPKSAASPAPKPVEAAPPAQPVVAPQPTAPAAPELRAPQSWRPEIREKWNALPEEVRQEVLRREREAAKALEERAPDRKFREQLEAVINPYRPLMTDEPARVIGNLLQTAAALQTAPPAQKANLVAQLIQTYGVPVEALAAALDGQPQQPEHAQPSPAQYRDPRLDAILARAQQAQQQKAAQELESFRANAEFIEDVREDMADLLEVASKRGVSMTLEQAYNRACLLHPEVSKVMEQRKAAAAAANAGASTQNVRNAASSVRSTPAAPVGSKGDTGDIRSLLEASWNAASGR